MSKKSPLSFKLAQLYWRTGDTLTGELSFINEKPRPIYSVIIKFTAEEISTTSYVICTSFYYYTKKITLLSTEAANVERPVTRTMPQVQHL